MNLSDREHFRYAMHDLDVVRQQRDVAEAEVARLREENEHLLALENGDWRARYSDASRETERLREALHRIIAEFGGEDDPDPVVLIAREALRNAR